MQSELQLFMYFVLYGFSACSWVVNYILAIGRSSFPCSLLS